MRGSTLILIAISAPGLPARTDWPYSTPKTTDKSDGNRLREKSGGLPTHVVEATQYYAFDHTRTSKSDGISLQGPLTPIWDNHDRRWGALCHSNKEVKVFAMLLALTT